MEIVEAEHHIELITKETLSVSKEESQTTLFWHKSTMVAYETFKIKPLVTPITTNLHQCLLGSKCPRIATKV